jgi:hypothetical protein
VTRDRLVAIRRFLTFEEPCDPPMCKEEIDVILRLAEQQIDPFVEWQQIQAGHPEHQLDGVCPRACQQGAAEMGAGVCR